MSFPFPYVNHGPLEPESIDKAGGCTLVLAKAPTKAARAFVERGCPEPIRGFFEWDGAIFTSESEGDVFDALVIELYGSDEDRADFSVSYEAAEAFSAAVADWVQKVHAKYGVRAFVGPGFSAEHDDWDQWSREELFRNPVPGLEEWASEPAGGDP